LFEQMRARVAAAADGAFLRAMHDVLGRYERGEPIRPTLPNRMQFIYMRDRQTFTFLLFPELLEVAYQAGRAIGAAFDAPRRTGITLAEALASAIGVAEEFDYGRQSVVEVRGETFARYRTEECADCYGLPDIGLRLCVYEAGVAAGALETVLGRPVRVTEVRCVASGDPYDEFEIHAEEQS
jgi:predicted hydrocarbon binding protein